ncbi:MAG: hypothetical protein AAGB13_12020 [Cyanobacteria bacterium P01_F01_bin.33]
MSQQLKLEISDETYADLQQKANSLGLSISEWAIALLTQQKSHDKSSQLSPEQQKLTKQSLLNFAGAVNLGHETGADNEAIDVDLAKAYLNEN